MSFFNVFPVFLCRIRGLAFLKKDESRSTEAPYGNPEFGRMDVCVFSLVVEVLMYFWSDLQMTSPQFVVTLESVP